jgi:hypothetical protein
MTFQCCDYSNPSKTAQSPHQFFSQKPRFLALKKFALGADKIKKALLITKLNAILYIYKTNIYHTPKVDDNNHPSLNWCNILTTLLF